MSDDFQIIRAVLDGDREAYSDLVLAYHSRVRGLCRSLLLDSAEADDAAQDVFIKAFESLHQYRQDLSFMAWLYRIASNHCLDVLRKRKRRKTDSLDGLMDQQGDHFLMAPSEGMDAGAAKGDKADRVKLAMQVLSSLSEEQRQILVLRELDGLSYEDIGTVLHCSLDGVKARLRRARQKLQEKSRHFLGQQSFIK